MQLVSPAGKYLMSICLMSDIPNELVIGRVEHIMHRHRQLDRPEARARMPANARARIDNKLSNLIRYLLQVFDLQLAQITRGTNL